jgi:hypothetical protein
MMGCYADFHHVCVTAAQYNESEFCWEKINAPLMGTWAQSNDTVNLRQLRQQILAMQKAFDNDVSSAKIAKPILDELMGFNPFNLLKYSFWYLAGISVLLFICFLVLSVGYHTVQRQLLGLGDRFHWEYLRN